MRDWTVVTSAETLLFDLLWCPLSGAAELLRITWQAPCYIWPVALFRPIIVIWSFWWKRNKILRLCEHEVWIFDIRSTVGDNYGPPTAPSRIQIFPDHTRGTTMCGPHWFWPINVWRKTNVRSIVCVTNRLKQNTRDTENDRISVQDWDTLIWWYHTSKFRKILSKKLNINHSNLQKK
jgi:hypothetical protein